MILRDRKGNRMRLSSSSGDFAEYVDRVEEKVAYFKGTNFKYINLEQSGDTPELRSENYDDWKSFAERCARVAEESGLEYVLSHAPCLHNPVFEALEDRSNEQYRANVRDIRRSIEVCNYLKIPHIVIHACASSSFTKETFYKYNTMFYNDLLDLAEKYGVTILTENWDNDASLFSTGGQMREFIDSMDHPLLGACWDTAHGNLAANAKAIGQYENIIALGDKLQGLHISDNFGNCHHHSWPFAGIINFDQVMQGLCDVGYKGYFNFEASYTILHHRNMPYHRKPWEHGGKTVTTLLDPPIEIKQQAVDLLYNIGKYILETYDCFEE